MASKNLLTGVQERVSLPSVALDTLFTSQIDEARDRPWMTFGSETITYGDAAERSVRAGDALAASGVRDGQRFAVLATNRPEFFELLTGAVQVGAVMVALNWRLHADELNRIVEDAEARLLFASPQFADLAVELRERSSTVETVVVFDETYRSWIEDGADGSRRDSGRMSSPDDVVLQLYTSGTTGLPKGVMSSRAAADFSIPRVVDSWGFSRDTVALVPMPLFHIGGIGWALVATAASARLVLLDDADPDTMLDAMEKERVTDIMVVPAQIQMLCDAMEKQPRNLPALRRITYAAAPIPEALLRRAIDRFGVEMHQIYGQTECFAPITQLVGNDHDPAGRPDLLTSCGKPVPWAEVATFDTTDKPTAEGEPGEVRVRSPHNMLGYWRNPEQTAETIVDGWLRTGDVGVFRDGYLYLIDRLSDVIITGGENVYPAEVERVLLDHSAVRDAAVIGIPSERWGESPVAAVVIEPNTQVTAEELDDFTRNRLASFKCPVDIRITERIDRNATGKIDRRAIRRKFSPDAG